MDIEKHLFWQTFAFGFVAGLFVAAIIIAIIG